MRLSRRERELLELEDFFHFFRRYSPPPKIPKKSELIAKAKADLEKAKQGLSDAKNAAMGACEAMKISRAEMEEEVKKAHAIKAFEKAQANEEKCNKKIAELEHKIAKNNW